jgi:hypothetical protein
MINGRIHTEKNNTLRTYVSQLCPWHRYYSVYSRCHAMTAKQTNKQRPFLGNRSVNTTRGNEYVRSNRFTVGNGVFY